MDLLNVKKQLEDYNLSFKEKKSKEELNKGGQFPTPIDLALEIVQYTEAFMGKEKEISFLEPALGNGIFYLALLQTTKRNIRNAFGIEKDSDISNFATVMWELNSLQVINKDFTEWTSDEKFNLLITNPPYIRHQHLSSEYKKELQLKVKLETGFRISGYAGFYVYYMLLAHKFLKENAISAWLIPAEFMSVNYGAVVRYYLTSLVRVRHIHQYDIETSKFNDALVSSAVVVFSNELATNEQKVVLSYGGSISNPDIVTEVSIKKLFETEKWSNLFRRNHEVNDIKNSSLVLGDFFYVKRGIATGNNNFFIMSWSKAKELKIPRRCYNFVLPSSSKISSNVIEVGEEGQPIIDDILVVIDTDLDKNALQVISPELYNYLVAGESEGVNEGYLLKKRKTWYKQENREPAPFLCTYMARGKKGSGKNPFRFIHNKSQAITTNNYLMIYPKKELKILLTDNSELYEKVFEELNQITEKHFSDNGREYGGGLKKMEPKELMNLPIGNLIKMIKEK